LPPCPAVFYIWGRPLPPSLPSSLPPYLRDALRNQAQTAGLLPSDHLARKQKATGSLERHEAREKESTAHALVWESEGREEGKLGREGRRGGGMSLVTRTRT